MSQVEETVLEQQAAAQQEIPAPEDFSDVECDDDENGHDLTYAIPAGPIESNFESVVDEATAAHKASALTSIGLSPDFLTDTESNTVYNQPDSRQAVQQNKKKKHKPRQSVQVVKPATKTGLDQLAAFYNKGERQESCINYVFFDTALTVLESINSITEKQYNELCDANSSITRMRKHVRPNAVDVIINPMNCRHKFYGLAAMMRDILPRLGEADAAIGERAFHRVGTYSFAPHVAVNYPEVQKYVFNLYVQFSHGDKKNQIDGVPVKPLHMKYTKHGLMKLLRMFDKDTNVGIVMFGEDRIAQTDWIDIEPMIEEVCRKLGRKITVFVPSRVLIGRTNKLGVNVANAARAKGMLV